jgi:ribonuclease HII
VAGVDEAGRGAWAGPLVAGAVILNKNFPPKMVNDSKQLTKKRREQMFVHITKHATSWSVAIISPEEIDKIGIQEANRVAMERAVSNLHVRPHAVLTDALPIRVGKLHHKAIVRGDQKVLSIAAASIVAKVVRDTLMESAHKRFPEYSFKMNKGYGTAKHQAALKKHGITPLHRRSYEPVRAVLVPKRRR